MCNDGMMTRSLLSYLLINQAFTDSNYFPDIPAANYSLSAVISRLNIGVTIYRQNKIINANTNFIR